MSRHKLVKNLNLDDELIDFDGNDAHEAGDEDKSPEDKEQLQEGTAKVRSILGPDMIVSDDDIQESLWYYYYDVEKTVNYILNQRIPRPKKSKKPKHDGGTKAINGHGSGRIRNNRKSWVPLIGVRKQYKKSLVSTCSGKFSAADFFEDAPWLDIPTDRCGRIIAEPLYPLGRLLGGASTQGGKVSKLAALAAARKRKGNEKPHEFQSQSSATSVALLDKLTRKDSHTKASDGFCTSSSELDNSKGARSGQRSRSLREEISTSERKGQDLISKTELKAELPESQALQASYAAPRSSPVSIPKASPSKFARTMFGEPDHLDTIDARPSRPLCFNLAQGQGSDTKFGAFSGPSPDDIVLKAQNSKGLKTNKSARPQDTGNKATASVEQSVSDLTIGSAPKARSKNLDVVAEFERSKPKDAANFVVIGHVDAGKSTLMGRLLYDLKVVDQRTLEKYKKESESIGKSSFALAWVLDQGTEERARGVTIDIATNKFETPKTSFTILDAPGHRDFIPNMIAGASQADFAVLVIDASTGNFESGLKGQTKEHALLVRSMGITRIVVAINKLDIVSWSQDRYSEISTQVSAFLIAAGFLPKNIAFVPCSGLTGDNIVYKSQNNLSAWYAGPPLLSVLESSEPISRALEKPLRLTINDIFRGSVANPLSISGRLDAGSIQTGDNVLAMPASETASIRAIEVDTIPCEWAVAGQNVVLHLNDIDVKHIKPGDVICTPSTPIKNISSFTMKVLAFEHIMPMHVEVHRGRLYTPGRISQLLAVLDKSSGAVINKGKRLRIIKPGNVARVVVELENVVPLETAARVVLRSGGETVGTGVLE